MRVAVSLVLLVTLATGIAVAESVYQSKDEWKATKRVKKLGWDAKALKEVDALIETGNSTCMVVTVGDELLYQWGDSAEVSYVASVRKSVLAILYGPSVKDGTINLEATLNDLKIDDVQGLLPIEKKAIVLDLITARSGVYHPASNEGDSREFAPERGSQEPGKYYLYNNWDFNASGTILEQQTGRSIYDIYRDVLVEPLGMQDYYPLRHRRTGDSSLSQHLAYHLHISTRDMARIGYLMLRDGNWFGNQVVDSEWIKTIRSTYTPLKEMNPQENRDGDFAYGYMWWIYAGDDPRLEGAYTASGAFGQFIMVIPRLDMVIAHKTNPSLADRTEYANEQWKITVTLEDFLSLVRKVVDAKLPE